MATRSFSPRVVARHAVIVAILALACNPVFFVIYRLMIFNTVPKDDYAPFLLWLVGAPGGGFPESPYGYRVLSMVAAAPFYYVLPSFHLTNLPAGLAEPYVRATAAIAALSYLSLLLATVLAYRTARDRCNLDRHGGMLAGVVLFVLALHSQIFGIDGFAILLVTAGVFVLPDRYCFASLIIASVFCNEKVAIVFAIWLTLRCALYEEDRHALGVQWITSLLAIALYAVAIRAVHISGNSYQLDPAQYFTTLLDNIAATFSPRGLILNVLPVAVLFAVAWAGRQFGGAAAYSVFRAADIYVIPLLALVALVLTQRFQMGRIVMHSAPLFAVPFAAAMGRCMAPAPPTR